MAGKKENPNNAHFNVRETVCRGAAAVSVFPLIKDFADNQIGLGVADILVLIAFLSFDALENKREGFGSGLVGIAFLVRSLADISVYNSNPDWMVITAMGFFFHVMWSELAK